MMIGAEDCYEKRLDIYRRKMVLYVSSKKKQMQISSVFVCCGARNAFGNGRVKRLIIFRLIFD